MKRMFTYIGFQSDAFLNFMDPGVGRYVLVLGLITIIYGTLVLLAERGMLRWCKTKICCCFSKVKFITTVASTIKQKSCNRRNFTTKLVYVTTMLIMSGFWLNKVL